MTKEGLVKELKSFLITFLAIFVVDAGALILSVYNGDWSKPVLVSLGTAALRSLIKAIIQLLWPQKFGRSFLDGSAS